MTPEQRAAEALAEFDASIRSAVDNRSRRDLDRAATMLSVLRAELLTTDVGQERYAELEARHDHVSEQLDESW